MSSVETGSRLTCVAALLPEQLSEGGGKESKGKARAVATKQDPGKKRARKNPPLEEKDVSEVEEDSTTLPASDDDHIEVRKTRKRKKTFNATEDKTVKKKMKKKEKIKQVEHNH